VSPTSTAASSPTEEATATPLPTATVEPPPVPTQAPAPPSTGQTQFTIHATNFAFSPDSIVVASGSTVTIHFVNDDRGVSHNIAFSLSQLQFTTPCEGGCQADLSFTAPAPGQYAFSCSVHPYMTGTLIVQ
jgi:plastocyanin